jgi:hypothetical protein
MPGSNGEHHARGNAVSAGLPGLPAIASSGSETADEDYEGSEDDRVDAGLPGQRGGRQSGGDRPSPAMRPGRLAAADGRS